MLSLISIRLLVAYGTQGHDRSSLGSLHVLWEVSSDVCVRECRAEHRKTSRQPWRARSNLYSHSWSLSTVWQEGDLSNCLKPHIVTVDKESLLSPCYNVQERQTKDVDIWKPGCPLLALWTHVLFNFVNIFFEKKNYEAYPYTNKVLRHCPFLITMLIIISIWAWVPRS